MKASVLYSCFLAASIAGAQYFPPTPDLETEINGLNGAYISFKEVMQ